MDLEMVIMPTDGAGETRCEFEEEGSLMLLRHAARRGESSISGNEEGKIRARQSPASSKARDTDRDPGRQTKYFMR